MKLHKVLIANRGEIAIRIIRACKELNIKTVAVCSEADKHALHTRFADEAYLLGPPPATQSYLKADKIIEIAKKANCDAIHPGYGFLSENAEFARAVEESGLAFIGPPADAIELMGNKLSARKTAEKNGIPIVPGMNRKIKALSEAVKIAEELGYPLMIKASAGGGGKGMRVVHHKKELKSALERATSEAQAAFGDPSVYFEKFIRKAKHIEFQVLCDAHGNSVHLFERECSIQRRHQKLVEESPAPLLPQKLRAQMGEAAVKLAEACGYRSAGTIEFLYDADEEKYYFLEANTRLQVEHPVTEMRTGIDLVKEQLVIASGKRLAFSQDDIQPRGAAIECRIYAEDPQNDFLPSMGVIEELITPMGPGVRVDHGLYRGERISRHYDSLLAKLIVWAANRDEAIARMQRALEEFKILGVKTTIGFHLRVMESKAFKSGHYFTDFIERMGTPEAPSEEFLKILAIAAALKKEQESRLLEPKPDELEAWKAGASSDEIHR